MVGDLLSNSTVRDILDLLPKVDVYLLSGPTGSGKTTIADDLSSALGAAVIRMDDYFLDEENILLEYSDNYGPYPQWDSPESIDLRLLIENLSELLSLGIASVPVFSFIKNRRLGMRSASVPRNKPIIVEGIYATLCKEYLRTRKITSFSIFITADASIRAKRILDRDSKERGRSTSQFEKRFHFIKSSEQQWIMKQADSADMVIDTTSGWPTCVFI